MALTDAIVRNSKPHPKACTLKDIQGLTLYVAPSGSKSWHFRYTLNGKRFRISLGQYPVVSLKQARQHCEEAWLSVKQGLSPVDSHLPVGTVSETDTGSLASEDSMTVETFAEFVAHWKAFKFKKLGLEFASKRQSTHSQIERYLAMDILPLLGNKPINGISRREVLAVQRKIEARGSLSVAEKCRGWLKDIFRHAIAEGLIEHNPASDLDIVALPQQPAQNNPYLRMDELPAFLAALHQYRGAIQTRLGIELLLLTGVRTGELRQARPEQFDLEQQLWRIPAEQMKQLQKKVRSRNNVIPPYIVPLSRQAVAIVQQLLATRYTHQPYLLCHRYDLTLMMSENTLNSAIKRLGYKDRLTGHGIRATLSTALNELDYPKEWIEALLSHSDKDQIRATYNHAQYVTQRMKMMQEWADRIDQWREQGLSNPVCPQIN